jgi:hypothetical protein
MIKHFLHLCAFALSFNLLVPVACSSGGQGVAKSSESLPPVAPSPPIAVLHANSPEERAYLEEAFVGITSDGVAEQGLFSIQKTGASTDPIRDAVSTFLSSLSPDQLASCTFPIDDDEWRRWHNIDFYEREGIALFEMAEAQRALAFNILETSLSAGGVQKAKNIMAMEEYLKEVTIAMGNHSGMDVSLLGADKFYFTFMGTPSETEPWGWQIDGHHLVVNYFILGDQVVVTPTFMGSELTHIEKGPNQGTRTFVEEGNLGLAFYRSLSEEQKQIATLLDSKQSGYSRTEGFRDNEMVPYRGLKAGELSKKQQAMLLELVEEYVGNIRDEHAALKMKEVKAFLDQTHFAWIGGSGKDDVFYYRIHSPVLLIEYDHHSPVFVVGDDGMNQAPVNWHVHTVVRTPNGNDYGKDLLKQHLEHHPHHAHAH